MFQQDLSVFCVENRQVWTQVDQLGGHGSSAGEKATVAWARMVVPLDWE